LNSGGLFLDGAEKREPGDTPTKFRDVDKVSRFVQATLYESRDGRFVAGTISFEASFIVRDANAQLIKKHNLKCVQMQPGYFDSREFGLTRLILQFPFNGLANVSRDFPTIFDGVLSTSVKPILDKWIYILYGNHDDIQTSFNTIKRFVYAHGYNFTPKISKGPGDYRT